LSGGLGVNRELGAVLTTDEDVMGGCRDGLVIYTAVSNTSHKTALSIYLESINSITFHSLQIVNPPRLVTYKTVSNTSHKIALWIYISTDRRPICDILYCNIILLYIDFFNNIIFIHRVCKTPAIVTCFY